MTNANRVKNPLEYKHSLVHELYLALNLLYEENKDRTKGIEPFYKNLPQSPSGKFAARVLERYRKASPADHDARKQQLFNQALVELIKAQYLCEDTRTVGKFPRWDVAALLASVRNTMQQLEKELHANSSDKSNS